MEYRVDIEANITITSSIHYGFHRRGVMLRSIAVVWWPNIHREVINTVVSCGECILAGKSFEVLRKENEFGKIRESSASNEEIALDFSSAFQNA